MYLKILANARAAALAHFGLAADVPTIYLGDRPYDLAEALALGWDFIGIGARIRQACEDANRMWIPDFTRGRVALEQHLDSAGDPLGLGRKEVRLVDHDPRWADIFAAEAKRLRAACGGGLGAIEHFGSTAVPGIPAKPMVDILATIPAMEAVAAVRSTLEALGYEFRPDAGHAQRAVFVYGSPSRFHLHLTTADAFPWRQNLHFRDRLCADPALARAYASVKRACLEAHPTDRMAYTEAKGDFIRAIKDEV